MHRIGYFRHAACKSHLTIADFLHSLGVSELNAWKTALSGKGWWRLAGSPAANHAMSDQWFLSLGLVNLTQRYVTLQA